MQRKNGRALLGLKWAAFLGAVALFAHAVGAGDLGRAYGEILGIGPALVLVLVPYLVAMAVDVIGWRQLLGSLGRAVPFWSFLGVRLSSEAVLMSLPGGQVIAESMAPYLLRERCQVPLSEGYASLGLKKGLFTLAHAVVILTGALLGYASLRAISPALVHGAWLPWGLLATGVVVLAASVATLAVLLFGSVAERLNDALAAFPSARVRGFFADRRQGFLDTDKHVTRALSAPKERLVGAVLAFLAFWIVESLETLLIVRMLGVKLGLVEVLSFEAVVSLLRSLAFFVPAGLGVQDIGYMAFFRAFGVPDAATTGAAFVLIKRAKEVFWIAVGYLLMLSSGPRVAPVTAET